MNRIIKEVIVKRCYYDSYDQPKAHLYTFLMVYNFAKRLKTHKGLIFYEYICQHIGKKGMNDFALILSRIPWD